MRRLKLLTLNLHCLEEENIIDNQNQIIAEILKKDVDVVLLQEVAQYENSSIVRDLIKDSNYGYQLQQLLLDKGEEYHYYFEPIKSSFGKYDEGVAILSKHVLHNVKSNYISKNRDYANWKTRKMIKGDLERIDKTVSFVSVHLGWTDELEVFEDQVERLLSHLDDNNVLILAGDFNVNPKSKEYGNILNKGLSDLYGSIPKFLFDPTFGEEKDVHDSGTRIDYIFANMKLEVLNREVLFKENKVSDHYGVYLEIRL